MRFRRRWERSGEARRCFRKSGSRGQGIGTALLEQLKDQLRKESVTRIDVGVHLENPEARHFYEKLGFVALNEERLACVNLMNAIRPCPGLLFPQNTWQMQTIPPKPVCQSKFSFGA
jgi:RimJ/RimL family protein N-acetyltransferase